MATTSATTTTTTAKSSLGASIVGSLNAGSGIDTDAIITKLTAAQKASLEAPITTAQARNAAQISGTATIASNIAAFSTSLDTLIAGGTLMTQAVSSDASVMGAAALPGSRLGSLTASVTVSRLAQAQTLMSQPVDAQAVYASGTLTLATTGGTRVPLTAGSDFTDLASLARAVNARTVGTGITASIVTDTAGRHLVLKGASGEAKGFSIEADGDVAGFAYAPQDGDSASPDTATGAGMQRLQVAQDSAFTVDGVAYTRASNSIDDAIAGVRLTLTRTGSATIGTTRPTASIAQAVSDFVAAYNALKSDLDTATAAAAAGGEPGALRGNTTIRDMQRQLRALTTTRLTAGGAISTLAELGVRTGQDGTLSVDTRTLNTMLATYPDDVEAMFNPAQSSSADGVSISSRIGKVAAGRYALTDLVAAANGAPASGRIDGAAMTASGQTLSAPKGSAAEGLTISLSATPPSSATISIDLGIGGALARIKDALTGTNGSITVLQSRLKAETGTLADRLADAGKKLTVYNDRLVRQFAAMNTRVSAFKATQSYLTQQVDLWTKSSS